MVILAYVLAAYGLSWVAWGPLVATGGAPADSPLRYLHLLGGVGPAAAALLATRLFEGPAGFRSACERIVRWRVGPQWHVIAWASPFVLLAVSLLLIRLGGFDDRSVTFGRSAEYPRLPMPLYWAASIIAYGFGEEIGWRGFLLPRLQARVTALTATLLLSIVWAGWHLPLFWFAPGMSRMGGAEIMGWYFSLLAGSLLFTWLFNATSGSVFIPAVFHGTMDIAFTASGPALLPMVLGALITVWGLAVLIRHGPSNLASGPRVTEARKAHPR